MRRRRGFRYECDFLERMTASATFVVARLSYDSDQTRGDSSTIPTEVQEVLSSEGESLYNIRSHGITPTLLVLRLPLLYYY